MSNEKMQIGIADDELTDAQLEAVTGGTSTSVTVPKPTPATTPHSTSSSTNSSSSSTYSSPSSSNNSSSSQSVPGHSGVATNSSTAPKIP